jgi:hypothetical protein
MKPPIVINDSLREHLSGDLGVYRSVELAERSIEFDDAADDRLRAYDGEGRVLRIVGDRDRRRAHLEADGGAKRDVLISILRVFLVRLGEPRQTVEGMQLEQLLSLAYDRDPDPCS